VSSSSSRTIVAIRRSFAGCVIASCSASGVPAAPSGAGTGADGAGTWGRSGVEAGSIAFETNNAGRKSPERAQACVSSPNSSASAKHARSSSPRSTLSSIEWYWLRSSEAP
jgi:hypothetical protein